MIRLFIILNLVFTAAASANFCSEKVHVQAIAPAEHPSFKAAVELMELKKQPLQSTVLFSSPHHGDTVEVIGVPQSAELVDYGEDEVFRYYLSDETITDKLLSEGKLQAGILPYVIVHPQVRKEYYYSLEGIFITKPGFEPQQVGLERNPNMNYVDFTLPKGLGLIQLEPGIFLIPGKPATAPWIMDAYLKFRASGATQYPAGYENAFKNIERSALKEDPSFNFDPVSARVGGVVKPLR